MKIVVDNNIKTFEDLLNHKYGDKGTSKREDFHARAKAYYICEMLKEERKKAKMTQTQLAERADMKKEVISRIENGKIDVQLSTFLRVIEGLGLQLKLVNI
jgi:HTH-type transcriptional regulator / antitoxin HipB